MEQKVMYVCMYVCTAEIFFFVVVVVVDERDVIK